MIMIMIKHMKSLMNKLILYSLVLLFMSSCSFQTKNSIRQSTKGDCISIEKSIERKVQLENEIRGQVKFLEEAENFSSITDRMSEYNIPALSLTVINKGAIEWADIYKNANFPEVAKPGLFQHFPGSIIVKTSNVSCGITHAICW